ncbi:MAG: hypothetical protein HY540_00905, partial [Deltaproteobacteria bacterium]|nr:hypothetical protein [Deltaproteobacteria bacterium]
EGREQQPVCILIDDYHNAEQDTRAFVESFALGLDQHAPTLCKFGQLIVVATEEKREGSLQLPRLGLASVKEYIERVLGPIDRLTTTADVLYRYSGGLPLLMVEGLTFMAPHIFQGRALEHLLPPPHIGLLYGEKMRELNPDVRAFLSMVALLFRPGTAAECEAILQLSLVDVNSLAEACRRHDLISEETTLDGGPKRYRMSSQALALDVIARLEPQERCGLHRRIAAGLVTVGAIFPSEIAYHFEKAGDAEKAADYYRQAGEKAKLDGQLNTAASFFTKAVDLTPRAAKGWQTLLEEAGRLLILTGDFSRAASYLQYVPASSSAKAEELKGWLALKQHDFAAAKACYEKALRLLGPVAIRERILILNAIANADLHMGRVAEAAEKFRATLALEEGLEKQDIATIDNNNLGIALALEGKIHESIQFYESRLKKGLAGDTLENLNLLSGLGYALITASRFKEAIDCLETARRTAMQLQAHHALFAVLGNLMTAYFKEARHADALIVSKELLSIEQRRGSPRDIAFSWLRQGSICLILGMEEAARECFQQGEKICADAWGEGMKGWFALMEGHREREFGSRDQAVALFGQAETSATAVQDLSLLAWVHYSRADMAYDHGDRAGAKASLDLITWTTGDVEFETRKALLTAKVATSSVAPDEIYPSLKAACEVHHFFEILWEVYHAWGLCELRLGRRDKACDLLEQGIVILKNIMMSLPEEYRSRYIQPKGRQALYRDWKQYCLREIDTEKEIVLVFEGVNDLDQRSTRVEKSDITRKIP